MRGRTLKSLYHALSFASKKQIRLSRKKVRQAANKSGQLR